MCWVSFLEPSHSTVNCRVASLCRVLPCNGKQCTRTWRTFFGQQRLLPLPPCWFSRSPPRPRAQTDSQTPTAIASHATPSTGARRARMLARAAGASATTVPTAPERVAVRVRVQTLRFPTVASAWTAFTALSASTNAWSVSTVALVAKASSAPALAAARRDTTGGSAPSPSARGRSRARCLRPQRPPPPRPPLPLR